MSDDSQANRIAVLKFLQTQSQPVSAGEISKELKISSRQLRDAIWRLTAASEAEITEDWKLKHTGKSVPDQVLEPETTH